MFKQKVVALYRKYRANNLTAIQALAIARSEARQGNKGPFEYDCDQTIDQSVGPYRVVFTLEWDSNIEGSPIICPWKEYDGHGVVKTSTCRPGESFEAWVLYSDRWDYTWYDWKATLPIAIRDGWGAPPYGVGNKHERAMRVMKADYEHLRKFCHDQWRYTSIVVDIYEDDEILASDSLGGVETVDMNYVNQIARNMAANLLRNVRRSARNEKRQARIASRFADAMTCGV